VVLDLVRRRKLRPLHNEPAREWPRESARQRQSRHACQALHPDSSPAECSSNEDRHESRRSPCRNNETRPEAHDESGDLHEAEDQSQGRPDVRVRHDFESVRFDVGGTVGVGARIVDTQPMERRPEQHQLDPVPAARRDGEDVALDDCAGFRHVRSRHHHAATASISAAPLPAKAAPLDAAPASAHVH